ncbi:MAG: CBS domain-containing protein [Candidatus Hydrothermarchaeota archaeon]|nr:CBS domain-containing protein [Candidatus Hydrothermarchaeota archaeon]
MVEIEKCMSSEVAVAPSTETVSYARNLMLKKKFSRVIVVEGEKPVGIITKKDIARRLGIGSAPWRRRPIDTIALSRVMSKNLITLPPSTSIKKAAELMIKKNISSILILDGEFLVGIVTKTDMLRAYAENYAGVFKNRELMSKNVVTANRHHTMSHLVELMNENNFGRIVIVDGRKPIGIVTSSDLSFADVHDRDRGIKIRRVLYVRKPKQAGRPMYRYIRTFPLAVAEDLMSTNLLTALAEDDAAEAAKSMYKNEISSLPVVNEEDELEGIITKTDIARGILLG